MTYEEIPSRVPHWQYIEEQDRRVYWGWGVIIASGDILRDRGGPCRSVEQAESERRKSFARFFGRHSATALFPEKGP